MFYSKFRDGIKLAQTTNVVISVVCVCVCVCGCVCVRARESEEERSRFRPRFALFGEIGNMGVGLTHGLVAAACVSLDQHWL